MSKLTVSNLSCQKGYNLLFENLSFEVSPGEVMKISGSNGSGKTSLLRIIAGLSSPESGFIEYNQKKTNSRNHNEKFLYLGHQSALSPELTCIENLEYLNGLSSGVDISNIQKALKEIGLNGYENDFSGSLSAGQKRKIVLSMLFITRAKVWLLDEPFTALDSNGIQVIENQIENHCNNGGLCILTTHQKSNIKNLKEVLI